MRSFYPFRVSRSFISFMRSGYLKLLLLLLCALSSKEPVHAQGFEFRNRTIDSTVPGQVIKALGLPYTLNVENDVWGAIQSDPSVQNKVKQKTNDTYVKLWINHNTRGAHVHYMYKVVYNLTGFYNPLDTSNTYRVNFTDTLLITYNRDSLSPMQDIDMKLYPRLLKARLTVTDIYAYDDATAQPVSFGTNLSATDIDTNFRVSLGMTYQPYVRTNYGIYNMDVVALPPVFDPFQKTLNVSWKPVQTQYADILSPASYDLEWTFVEDYDPNGFSVSPYEVYYSFNGNATRVTVNDTQFHIPAVYPRGYIIYRVRMVRPDSALYKAPIYGNWSDNLISGRIITVPPDNYWYSQPLQNDSTLWNYTISFSESGKYKHLLNFGDGLGKKRQSVTRFQSDAQRLLLSEDIFDYEGRPAITLLPTPVTGSPFQYVPGVAKGASTNGSYTAPLFDQKITTICPGEVPIEGLHPTSKAALYYSSLNPDTIGAQKFVPDAGGFPFVRTIIGPGSNGKVEKQGGAGPEFQIGMGHESKYSYVSAEQTELNSLFGTNAGWDNYYRKTVARDPNGQASVTIKDYEGRLVSTSLIGDGVDKETHAIMTNDELPLTSMFSEDKLANAVQLKVGNEIKYNKNFFIDADATVTTKYVFKFQPYQICANPYLGLTVKAAYDYSITDECGVVKMQKSQILGNTGVVTNPGNIISVGQPTNTTLLSGKHTLDKTLTVNVSDIYDAVDSYMATEPNCLKNEKDFIRTEVDSAKFPCPGADPDEPCEDLALRMMQELFPGAKYGKYGTLNGTILPPGPGNPANTSIFDHPFTDALYRYQDPCVQTNLRAISFWLGGIFYKNLDSIPAAAFINAFVPGENGNKIARALLPLHPEYCKLTGCFVDTFKEQLSNIPDAKIATAFGLYNLNAIVAKDPLVARMQAWPFYYTQIADSLKMLRPQQARIDTSVAAWAYCHTSDNIIGSSCRDLFRQPIAQIQFSDPQSKDLYYTKMRDVYLSSRDKYVQMLKVGASTCGPCQDARMTLIPDPIVKTMYTASGSIDLTSPTSALNNLGTNGSPQVTQAIDDFLAATAAAGSGKGAIDSVAFKYKADSVGAIYRSIDSTLGAVGSDSVISKFVNCGLSIAQKNALKYNLMSLVNNGQVSLGRFTPAHIRNAMSASGIVPNDLCHPYLMTFDWIRNPPASLGTCYDQDFYTNAKDFFNRSQIVTSLTGNLPSGVQTLGPLNGSMPFEGQIIGLLGTADVSFNLQYAPSAKTYTIALFKANGVTPPNDTVKLLFRSDTTSFGGQALFTGASSLTIDTVKCVYEESAALPEGNIRRFMFGLRTTHERAGITYKSSLAGWTNGVTLNAETRNDIALCVPCTEFKKRFQQFADSMVLYGMKGVDHPFCFLSLRNFMNYSLNRVYSVNQYRNFLTSCALTDSMLLPMSGPYAYLFDSTQLAALTDEADAQGISFMPYLQYKYDATGANVAFIDYSGVPFSKVRTMNQLVVNHGGTVNQPFYGHAGLLFLPASTAVSSVVTGPYLNAGSGQNISLNMGGTWVSGYKLYEVSAASSLPYYYSRGLASLQDNLYNTGVYGILVPKALSTVNADYNKPQKQQYLAYTYQHQQLSWAKALDTLQEHVLEDQIPAFNGQNVTYKNPGNPAQLTDLFYTSGSGALPGWPILDQNILQIAGYHYGNDRAFMPQGVNTVAIQSGFTPNFKAYRCRDGLYWFRYYDSNNVLRNVYVRLPAYFPKHHHSSLKMVGLVPELGDSISRRFTLRLTDPYLGINDTFSVTGYADFDLMKTDKLHNVLLGDQSATAVPVAPIADPFLNPNCEQQILLTAIYTGKQKYQAYRDSVETALKSAFYAHVMGQIKEELWMSYPDRRFGTTLYVYDRAGNRIQTVPPEGVRKLTGTLLTDVNTARTAVTFPANTLPAHLKSSTYQYNSANQLTLQRTPDGGRVKYYYDRKGNLILTQNEKQIPQGNYTYRLYDGQNRVYETGETYLGACQNVSPVPAPAGATTPPSACYTLDAASSTWVPLTVSFEGKPSRFIDSFIRALPRWDVIYTHWDQALVQLQNEVPTYTLGAQKNLRSRIGCVAFYPKLAANTRWGGNYIHATHYSYDAAGNVACLVQDFPELSRFSQRFKRIDYEYDLHSGKVNLVAYNRGWTDQFYHRYAYDADNRLKEVETSTDGVIWAHDARYDYYQHGPLARLTLGEHNVQGIDFAYTLQGWLKAMNGPKTSDPDYDMGRDGTPQSAVAGDAFATVLDYYPGDYKPIGNTQITRFPNTTRGLYNGNIVRQSNDIRAPLTYGNTYNAATNTLGFLSRPFGGLTTNYIYDQLNRIRYAANLRDSVAGGEATFYPEERWGSSYTYDQDGNFKTLKRLDSVNYVRDNEPVTRRVDTIDNFTYVYDPSGRDNRLINVADAATESYSDGPLGALTDIRYSPNVYSSGGSLVNRLGYDPTGNLTFDHISGSTAKWNHLGKPETITTAVNDHRMEYAYDGSGQRVIMRYQGTLAVNYNTTLRQPFENTSYFVRDATGNVLATYRRDLLFVPQVPGSNPPPATTPSPTTVPIGTPTTVPWVRPVRTAYMPVPVTKRAYIDSVIIPLYAGLPNFTGLVHILGAGLPPNSTTTLSASQIVADRPELLPMLLEANPDWVPTLRHWSSVNGIPVLANTLKNQIPNQGNLYEALSDIVRLTMLYPDHEFALERTAAWMTALPDVANIVKDKLGLDGSVDSAEAVSEITKIANDKYGFLAGVISEHYKKDPYFLTPWLEYFTSDATFDEGKDASQIETRQYYVHSLYGSIEHGDPWAGNSYLLDFLDSWPAAGTYLAQFGGGTVQLAYADDPGGYLEALANHYGDDVLDSLVAAASPQFIPHIEALVRLAPAAQSLLDDTTKHLVSINFGLSEHTMWGAGRLGTRIPLIKQNYTTGLLRQRRPWYSSALNGRMIGDSTEAWGSNYESGDRLQHILGLKHYEMSNHLGNVQAVVSDKRGEDSVTHGYTAALQAAFDYYPYGMPMRGRYAYNFMGNSLPETRSIQVQSSKMVALLPAHQGWQRCKSNVYPSGPGGNRMGLQAAAAPPCLGAIPFVQAWGGAWRNVPSAGSGKPAQLRLQFSSNQIPGVFIEEDMGGGNFQVLASTPATQTPGGPFVQVYNYTPVTGSGVVRLTLALTNDQPVIVDSVLYKVDGPLVTQSMLVWNTYNSYEGYRYGYNGQDKVTQSFGEGAHTTAQFWEYDTRLARRWNIDPVDQIGISNYAVNGLNPIINTDPNGDDDFFSADGRLLWRSGGGRNNNLIRIVNYPDVAFNMIKDYASKLYGGDITKVNSYMRNRSLAPSDRPIFDENNKYTEHGKTIAYVQNYYIEELALKNVTGGYIYNDVVMQTVGIPYVIQMGVDEESRKLRSEHLNNVGDFKSVLIHEYDHAWGKEMYRSTESFDHLITYRAQLSDLKTWQNTSDGYRNLIKNNVQNYYRMDAKPEKKKEMKSFFDKALKMNLTDKP